jgi:hypothetical protein
MNAPIYDIATASNSGNGVNTITATITIPANSLILTTCHTSNNATSVPSSANLTFTQVGSDISYSANGLQDIYRAYATTDLTSEVITFTSSANPQISACVIALTPVDATGTNGSGAIGNVNTVSSAGTSIMSGTVITTRIKSLVIGLFGQTSNVSEATGAAQRISVASSQQPFSSSIITVQRAIAQGIGITLTNSVTFGSSVPCGGEVFEILAPVASTLTINNTRPRPFAPGIAR